MIALLKQVLARFGAPAERWTSQAAEVADEDWQALRAAAAGAASEAGQKVKAVVEAADQSVTRGSRRFVQFAAGHLHDLLGIVHEAEATPPAPPPPPPPPESQADPLV